MMHGLMTKLNANIDGKHFEFACSTVMLFSIGSEVERFVDKVSQRHCLLCVFAGSLCKTCERIHTVWWSFELSERDSRKTIKPVKLSKSQKNTSLESKSSITVSKRNLY